MWTYQQSTGKLSRDGEVIAIGYSGAGECKNQPARQDVLCQGPIPRGRYTIGTTRNTQAHGPIVLPLVPDAANEMCGRAGFLIHADSIRRPGAASEGCIILGRLTRMRIAESGDKELTVIA